MLNFINKRNQHIPVSINNIQVPYADTEVYLGMTLNTKLRWRAYLKKEKEEVNIKFKKM